MIASDPSLTPVLAWRANIPGLASYYWENIPGLETAIAFFCDPGDAPAARHSARARGLTHLLVSGPEKMAHDFVFLRHGGYDETAIANSLGGRLRNRLMGSNADYDLSVANYNQTLLGAIREVTDAVQGARALDAQIASTRIARDTAAKAHALVAQRYRAGLANQLDVLAAQKPLLQLDQQVATLNARRRTATIDLDQALGGGIAIEASNATASH